MPILESHHGYYLWHYVPSQPAAIVFIILFFTATIAHVWKMFRYRTWFCLPFVIGGIFEIIGYIGRTLAYDKTGELMPYIMQSTLLLLAPVLFAASLYMTLGRVIKVVHGEPYSLIGPSWLTRVFVFGDVFSFMIQGAGAGILSKGGSASDVALGEHVIVAGLIFQVVMFAVFVATAIHFNARFSQSGSTSGYVDVPWQAYLNMLYVTSAALMVRNVFRVIEFTMGQDGYLLSNEWTLYVFDGVLMLLTMAWFFLWYPGQLQHRARGGPGIELGSSSGEYSGDRSGSYLAKHDRTT